MITNKTVWNAVPTCNLKNDRMIAAHLQAKPLRSTVIQVHALNSNVEEAEVEWFSEDIQGLLELASKKLSFSLYWTGMQKWEVEISGLVGKFGVKSTKWSREKSSRVLPREHTGPANTSFQQHKWKLYTWTSPNVHGKLYTWTIPKSNWLYSLQPKMEKLYTVRKKKTGSWLWLRSWTPCCQILT